MASKNSVQFLVARSSLQHIVSHIRTGLQGLIHESLGNDDRRCYDDSSRMKLNMIAVIHEKVVRLFNCLKEAAENYLFPK